MFRIIFVGDVRSENLKLFTRMSHDKILQTYNDIKHQAERLASRGELFHAASPLLKTTD